MVKKLTDKKGSKPANTSLRVKKPRGKGKPFQPNNPETGFKDDRINRDGQNAKFTEYHRMLDRIFNEKIPINKDGRKIGEMTALEQMTRIWILSQDYNKQNKALEYYVGKVADELNVHSSEAEDFVKSNLDLFTDGQLERLGTGEKPWTIIAELLRDTIQAKRKQTESK